MKSDSDTKTSACTCSGTKSGCRCDPCTCRNCGC